MAFDPLGNRLASLDPETGERPSSRIGNAGNARTLVGRLKYEDEQRMYRYTRIQGLLDGNPPWPQKRLVDLGQGHRANFNLREGEGIVDSAKTPYYDLIFEVPQFAQITFGLDGIENEILTRWNTIISEEFHETLSAWNGFDQNIQLSQWQMIVNGIGPMFWPHSVSWRSEAAKCRKVLVPQETKANVEELEFVVVLHSWRADELESYIAGASEDEYNGWNVPLCKKAIIDSSMREMRQTWGTENYDLYQRAIRTGDLFYGIHRSDRIYVASLFIKEFGGKVSHYVITDQTLGISQESYEYPEEEVGYLYKKRNKYENFANVVCPFFFDTGPDGTWHSVKGLGPKIYDFCDVSNRTFCQMLDGAVIGSGITLEAQDGASLEETQIALVGGATVVQPGYKVVQTRIAESLNGAMNMRRELQNTLQSNTGSYRQRPSEGEEEPTLGQAQLNYQQQAMLGKGAINRYLNNLKNYETETLRRMMDPAQNNSVPGGKEAKEFQMRCVIRGIPEEVMKFRNIKKVRPVPSVGYGSPQMRDVATQKLVSMLPAMDGPGRNHALRMWASALPGFGPSQVDSIFPPYETQQAPTSHTSKAVDENNALRSLGGKALVEPSQDHSAHFDTHGEDIMAHQQEPNADPSDLLVHLNQAGAHMHQHLEALKGDPTRKKEVAQKTQQLDNLGKMTDQLQQQVEESAQAAQQPQNGQGPNRPEDRAAQLKTMGELGLKAKKQEGDFALKARKQQVDEKLKDAKTAAEIRRKNAAAQPSPSRGGGGGSPQPAATPRAYKGGTAYVKPRPAFRPPQRPMRPVRHYQTGTQEVTGEGPDAIEREGYKSIGIEISGQEFEVPALIPELTPEEEAIVRSDLPVKQWPPNVIDKIENHARDRLEQGLEPFMKPQELEGYENRPPDDTVPAMLAPGEAVLNAPAAQMIGRANIKAANQAGQQMMGQSAFIRWLHEEIGRDERQMTPEELDAHYQQWLSASEARRKTTMNEP